MQPIKLKEVWRVNGKFAPAPKIEEVIVPEKEDGTAKFFFRLLVIYSALLLFTPGWVIGLPIFGTYATFKGVQKYSQYQNVPKLVINKYW